MAAVRDIARPGFKYHLKVHSFRTFSVILAWVLIVAAFYERPDALTGAQRLIQRGIEVVGDDVPALWGPRIEFVFGDWRFDMAADHTACGAAESRTLDDCLGVAISCRPRDEALNRKNVSFAVDIFFQPLAADVADARPSCFIASDIYYEKLIVGADECLQRVS